MTSRRDFLIKSSLAALGLSMPLGKTLAGEQLTLDGTEKDWERIRKQFPLSKDVCYLNNGTLGPSPSPVLDAIISETVHVNESMIAPQKNEEAKESLAKMIRADASEIALTHNVTEGINIAVWAFDLRKGDEIILTDQEHVGNALPWLNRQRREGIVIKSFHPANTAAEVLNQVNDLITSKTKVIAIPHIPCTTGQIYPIKEICKLARSKGIYTLVDGAHGIGMIDLDMRDLDCDVYISCCHKWLLGPKGTGFMYIRKELIEDSEVVFVGGHTDIGWKLTPKEQYIKGFKPHAHRFHYGTQNYANFYGISAAVDFQLQIGRERIQSRVRKLNSYLLEKLQEIGSGIEIISPIEAQSRGAVLTFKFANKDNYDFVDRMRKEENLFLRYLSESGHNAVRVSTHIYNSFEEVDTLIGRIRNELK